MRNIIKQLLNRFAQFLGLPFAATCWLESLLRPSSEVVFTFWCHVFALLPGLPGAFIRRGFYSLVLEQCSLNCHMGFGTMFCHRSAIVEDNVYLGNYCTVGSARIGKNSLVGSRTSLLSGSEQHKRDDATGEWTAFSKERIQQISIGANVWIGEGAIVMADIGEGCQIGAGTVISTNTRDNVVLAGNPARFVKQLSVPDPLQEAPSSSAAGGSGESVSSVAAQTKANTEGHRVTG